MGHIKLAAPVVHIWFFKAMPAARHAARHEDRLLEKVIYFQDYVVIDPGDTPLNKQLLTEDEYRRRVESTATLRGRHGRRGHPRTADRRLDLDASQRGAPRRAGETRSKQKIKDLIKRLKIVEALRDSRTARSGWCWT
jgi:DNA-directed RNA polymerase subunit beta'